MLVMFSQSEISVYEEVLCASSVVVAGGWEVGETIAMHSYYD